MSISLTPCDKVEKYGIAINKECIADKAKQMSILTQNNIIKAHLIYNYEAFDSEKYKDAAILKSAGYLVQWFYPKHETSIFFEQEV